MQAKPRSTNPYGAIILFLPRRFTRHRRSDAWSDVGRQSAAVRFPLAAKPSKPIELGLADRSRLAPIVFP
jgi:hypothetical protein